MIENQKNNKNISKITLPSELRFDLVSGDWVVIATGRAKRPEMFKEKREKSKVSKKDCPFCHIESQKEPLLIFHNGQKIELKNKIYKHWTTLVLPNKFPAFFPAEKIEKTEEGGFFQKISGVGFCELVITKEHEKTLATLPLARVKEVFDAYQERYLALMREKNVNYISIFHNEGPKAGATQSHPHSQIITTPLIDIDLKKAILNSKKYYQKTEKCLYCQLNNWERKIKKRIVFENEDFLVLCPFASKVAFEMIISPKKHFSYFEKIGEKEKWKLAEAFHVALRKLYKGLNKPDYNFYLHTAPCDGEKYPYYHWHWTILPKTSIWAGFELGAHMEISTIEPEKAAEYLRQF